MGKIVALIVLGYIALTYQNNFGDHYAEILLKTKNVENLSLSDFLELEISNFENKVSNA